TLGVGWTLADDADEERLPAFDEAELFRVPNQLDLFAPKLDEALDATADLPFRWTRGSPEGYVAITLSQLEGEETVTRLACLAMDDGRFVVPASDLEGLEGTMSVSISRHLRSYHELAPELHLQVTVLDRTASSVQFVPR
nr:hypothetical protein [Myxococcales bacterium]